MRRSCCLNLPKTFLEVVRAKTVRPEFINFVVSLLRKTKLGTNKHSTRVKKK